MISCIKNYATNFRSAQAMCCDRRRSCGNNRGSVNFCPPTQYTTFGNVRRSSASVTCHKLKDKHLDCSMFERLINNEMQFTQLGRQCRMRDDIANLLRSLNIYKDLKTNQEVGHIFLITYNRNLGSCD